MTPIKRPLAAAGATVLLALSLSACGGGAPTDASKDDYCEAVQGASGDDDFTKALEDKDWDKIADLYKDAAEDVEEVGTPDDISDEEREGFEIQLDAIKSVNADDIEKAFDSEGKDPFEDELSDDEKDKVKAYGEYESETCSGATDIETPDLPEVPTDSLPTDGLPTDGLPTDDLPTDDLPTDDLPTSPEDLASLQSELEKLTEGVPSQ